MAIDKLRIGDRLVVRIQRKPPIEIPKEKQEGIENGTTDHSNKTIKYKLLVERK